MNQGYVFVPYIPVETVSPVSSDFAAKMVEKSRYSVAGVNQAYYMKIPTRKERRSAKIEKIVDKING